MAWYAGSARRDLLAMAAYVGSVGLLSTALVVGAASLVPPREQARPLAAETTGAGTEASSAERPARPPAIVEHRQAPVVHHPSVAAPKPVSKPASPGYAAMAKKKAQAEMGRPKKQRSVKRPKPSSEAREAYGYALQPRPSYAPYQHGMQ